MVHGNPTNSKIFCNDTGGLKELVKGGTKCILFLCIYNKKKPLAFIRSQLKTVWHLPGFLLFDLTANMIHTK